MFLLTGRAACKSRAWILTAGDGSMTRSQAIKDGKRIMRHRNYFLIRIFLLVFLLNLGPASALVYSQNYDNVTVKAAQENLQKLGYDPGPADGIWGRKTENALR